MVTTFALQAQEFHEYLAKGDELYSARQYEESLHYFTLAIGLEPQNPKGYYYRGDAYRELKNWEAAIEDYNNAVDLDPKNAKFRRLRGDSYYDMKNYVRAEADYTKAIALDPSSATTWLYRGDTYEMLKQIDKACGDYLKAHELGSRNGKPRAVKLSCPWTKQLTGNSVCPVGETAVTKVDMDPLTGAVVIGKALSFESYQLSTSAGALTGPEFAAGETLKVRITNARNFCLEEKGEVFLGVGYEIRENGGREVQKVHNVFPNDKSFTGDAGHNPEISIKLPAGMAEEKQHLLTVHFFDTKGNGEIFLELPFKITRTTLAGTSLVSRKPIGGNINTAGIGGTIGGLTLATKSKSIAVNFDKLQKETEYIATATNVMNINKHSHFIFRFVDQYGKIVLEHKGKAVYQGNHVMLDFKTEGLSAGQYSLWLKVQEIEAPQNIGLVVPVVVN